MLLKPAQTAIWIITIVACLACKPSAKTNDDESGSAIVSNGRQLAVALSDSNVEVIIVNTSIVVSDSDYFGLGALPLLVKRNVTIKGSPSRQAAGDLVVFDGAFVKNKVKLGPGVSLLLVGMVLTSYREDLPSSTPGMDLLAPSDAASENDIPLVILDGMALNNRFCFPTAWSQKSVAATPRPARFPGAQNVTADLPQPNCSSDPAAPWLSRCYVVRRHYYELITPGKAIMGVVGVPQATNYIVMALDTALLCTGAMSEECIAQYQIVGCYYKTFPRSAPPPSSNSSSSNGGSSLPTAGGGEPSRAAGSAGGGTVEVGGPSAGVAGTGTPPQAEVASAAGATARGGLTGLVASPASTSPSSPAEAGATVQGSELPNEQQGGAERAGQAATGGGGGGAGGGGDGGSNTSRTAVVVGCAVGSAALTVLFVAAFLVLRARRRGQAKRRTALPTALQTLKDCNLYDNGIAGAELAATATDVGEDNDQLSPLPALMPSALTPHGTRPRPLPRCGGRLGPWRGPPAAGAAAGVVAGAASVVSREEGSNGPAPLGSTAVDAATALDPATAVAAAAPDSASSPVTPHTPHRADLQLLDQGSGLSGHGATEVTLLPNSVRGRGSFGQVVEGMYLGQRVAVKLVADVHQWGGPSEELIQSFGQEVEVLGRCRHPNVVRLLAACLTPPRLCLVMELMETSLERLVYARPQGQLMALPTVLHIGIEISNGLAYLHPTILHRDLKPANVLINNPDSDRPIVKITDFGLARLRCTAVPTLTPDAGTPAYLAPEGFDASNNVITHQADIYSLGVLLWEMLAGERPWQGYTVVDVAFRVAYQGQRPPLNRLGGAPEGAAAAGGPRWVPTKLRRLLLHCWEADPRRRPAAAEVAKMLALILQEVERCDSGRAAGAAPTPSNHASPLAGKPAAAPPPAPPPAAAPAVGLAEGLAAGPTSGTGTRPPAHPFIQQVVTAVASPRGRQGGAAKLLPFLGLQQPGAISTRDDSDARGGAASETITMRFVNVMDPDLQGRVPDTLSATTVDGDAAPADGRGGPAVTLPCSALMPHDAALHRVHGQRLVASEGPGANVARAGGQGRASRAASFPAGTHLSIAPTSEASQEAPQQQACGDGPDIRPTHHQPDDDDDGRV